MTAPCTQRQFGFGLIVCMSVVTVSNMSYASTAEHSAFVPATRSAFAVPKSPTLTALQSACESTRPV